MKLRIPISKAILASLLLLMMASLARSIEQARWTEGLENLMPIGLIGVIAGTILAEGRFGTVRAHAVGAFAGFMVVMWQTGQVLTPAELQGGSRLSVVWARLREWLSVVLRGDKSYDELLFVFTMGAIVWFLAYNSSWFVLRYGWAWWAVLPVGLVMLVNLGYAVRADYSPFVVFLLASMLLMIQSHFTRNEARWAKDGLGREPGMGARVMILGGVISVALLALAWQGPTRGLQIRAKEAVSRLSEPWEGIQDRWQDAFAFLYPGSSAGSTQGIGGGFTSFEDNFALGGPLRLGTRLLFTARGSTRQYWMSNAYDTYEGNEWAVAVDEQDPRYANKTEITNTELPRRAGQTNLKPGLSRLEQQVTVIRPVGESIFAADSPVSTDLPAKWTMSPITRYASVPVSGNLSGRRTSLRAEALSSVRASIREIGPARIRSASAEEVTLFPLPVRRGPAPAPDSRPTGAQGDPVPMPTATSEPDDAARSAELLEGQLRQLRDTGIEATYKYERGKTPVVRYSYQEPNQDDLLSVASSGPLKKDTTYRVTSIVANPNSTQLNASRATLPTWVQQRYLEVPDSVPPRVRELTKSLTANAKTMHQKAQVIERYLRSMKYRADMPPTPAGRDFVDYFLFEQQEGYCTYYASAMAVMLRSIDIPARVLTGFAPGTFNQKFSRTDISEAQAHAWPQVYYPEYGWVNYEPTPIRSLVQRPAAPREIDNEVPPAGSVRAPQFDRLDREEAGTGGGISEPSEGWPAPARYTLVVLLAFVGAFVFIYLFSLLRLRGLRGASRQYAKLLQLGTTLGVGAMATETPNEYGARLAGEIPKADRSVRRITGEYVREVFGKQTSHAADLNQEWKRVRGDAVRSVPSRVASDVRRLQLGEAARRLLRR